MKIDRQEQLQALSDLVVLLNAQGIWADVSRMAAVEGIIREDIKEKTELLTRIRLDSQL